MEAKQTPLNYIIGAILVSCILFNKAIEPDTLIVVNSLLSLLKGLMALRCYYCVYSDIMKHADRPFLMLYLTLLLNSFFVYMLCVDLRL